MVMLEAGTCFELPKTSSISLNLFLTSYFCYKFIAKMCLSCIFVWVQNKRKCIKWSFQNRDIFSTILQIWKTDLKSFHIPHRRLQLSTCQMSFPQDQRTQSLLLKYLICPSENTILLMATATATYQTCFLHRTCQDAWRAVLLCYCVFTWGACVCLCLCVFQI